MTRLFILLFALVICAIAITRFWEKAGSRTEPKAENQKSYVTHNRTCIIFIMELWVLTAFFAFVPLGGMNWVLGMVFALVNALAYLVLWLFMFRHREKRIDDILMLFIPIYFFTGITIATWGLEIYYIITIVIGVITVTLTILSLIQKPEQNRLQIRNTYIVIMAVTSVIFTITCLFLTKWYYALYHSDSETQLERFLKYNPLYPLALLMIMFLLFLLVGKEKNREDRT